VAVLLSSALSGTFRSGTAAIRAGGLITSGCSTAGRRRLGEASWPSAPRSWWLDWPARAIVEELRRVRNRSGSTLTADGSTTCSGRASEGKGPGGLRRQPILLDDRVGWPVDRVPGPGDVVPRCCRSSSADSPRRTIRFHRPPEPRMWRGGSGRLWWRPIVARLFHLVITQASSGRGEMPGGLLPDRRRTYRPRPIPEAT
jgi:hypothetical protein